MRIYSIIIAGLCMGTTSGYGQDLPLNVDRGREIVEAVREQNTGFDTLAARIDMTLVNRRGQTHGRTMRMKMRENQSGGRYSLCLVESPPDVRGTILLSHILTDDDRNQWLYLPALRRIRRIAAQARSGAFMGSEFSYEDLIGHPLDQGNHRWLRDEDMAGRHCHVLEWIPADPQSSGYYRQIAWVDSSDFRLWRVDYYNRRQERQKTLTLSNYHKYHERFWYAGIMEMHNHLSGNHTRMEWSAVEIGTELDPMLFDPDRLGTLAP